MIIQELSRVNRKWSANETHKELGYEDVVLVYVPGSSQPYGLARVYPGEQVTKDMIEFTMTYSEIKQLMFYL